MTSERANNAQPRDKPKTFLEHLGELRACIIRCLIALVVGAVVSFPFQKLWQAILLYPGRKALTGLTWLNPPDIFILRIKLSLLGGLLLALPYIIWQIWLFVAPALHQHERRWVTRLSGVSLGLFWAGVMFAYWVIIPLAMRFFMSFGNDFLTPNITMPNYIRFATFILLAAGCAFQIPLVLLFLMRTEVVPRSTFARNRGTVLVVVFILAAFFTPPDAFTMLLMAGPLYLLFEASLWADAIMGKRGRGESPAGEKCSRGRTE